MATKRIKVLSGEYAYILSYTLMEAKNSFIIHLKATQYDKKAYLKDRATTKLCTETNFAILPTTIKTDIEDLFFEIMENTVFPVSLDYILEDM